MVKKLKNDFFECAIETDKKELISMYVYKTKDDGSIDMNEFEELSDLRIISSFDGYIAPLSSVDIKKLVLSQGIREIRPASFSYVHIDEIYWARECHTIASEMFRRSEVRLVSNIDNVTVIEDRAFQDDCAIQSFEIPKAIHTISPHCFSGAGKLSELSGIERITKIENRAFQNCTSLKNLHSLNSVFSIGEGAFFCSGIESVDLSNSVCSKIGNLAFAYSKINEFKSGYFLNDISPTAFKETKIQFKEEIQHGINQE